MIRAPARCRRWLGVTTREAQVVRLSIVLVAAGAQPVLLVVHIPFAGREPRHVHGYRATLGHRRGKRSSSFYDVEPQDSRGGRANIPGAVRCSGLNEEALTCFERYWRLAIHF